MKGTIMALVALLAAVGGCAKNYPTVGKIERLAPELDAILAPDARVEKLDGGFNWTEGPVWNVKGGFLLFDDIPENTTFKWQEGKGISPFLKPSGYTGTIERIEKAPKGWELGANGTTYDQKGNLILCQHGDRRVARLEPGGQFTTLADSYDGKRLNSPNDVVVKSNGDVYFTDPPYGTELKDAAVNPLRELDYCGVYRIGKDGKVTLLTKAISLPNGICFSPDEKTLYITVSDAKRPVILSFPVKEDGTLGDEKVFFDATKYMEPDRGGPDGIKVDMKGNVFSTGPNGIYIFSPDGKLLGRLVTSDRTANCNWGDDGSTLYITKNHEICRIKTLTKGKMPGA